MSAGNSIDAIYETDEDLFFAVKIQPETTSLTLNGVANASATGTLINGNPSASISGSKRKIGVNCRSVRFRFTGTLPPGYATNRTLTLPVLTPAAYQSYQKQSVGTYTLEGVAYDVAFVGKSPEKVN